MSSAIRILGIIMLTLSVFACDRSSRMVQRGEVVNLYSNCLSATDQDLFLPFETASGLKVNIISKPNYQVLDRILSLGEDSTNADVLLLRGVAYLNQAKQSDMLDTLPNSSLLRAIPDHLQDDEQRWLSLGYSTYVIAYLRDSVDSLQVRRYEQLTDERWKGKMAFSAEDEDFFVSLLASLMADESKATVQDWWRGLQDSQDGTPDSLRQLLLTNTSDYIVRPGWQLQFLQPETYLQLTGVGIRRNAPHPGRTTALFNYLFSNSFMKQFAESKRLFPSRQDVDIPSSLPGIDRFQVDTTSQSRIARLTEKARALITDETEATP